MQNTTPINIHPLDHFHICPFHGTYSFHLSRDSSVIVSRSPSPGGSLLVRRRRLDRFSTLYGLHLYLHELLSLITTSFPPAVEEDPRADFACSKRRVCLPRTMPEFLPSYFLCKTCEGESEKSSVYMCVCVRE